jgi:hypothetical protein
LGEGLLTRTKNFASRGFVQHNATQLVFGRTVSHSEIHVSCELTQVRGLFTHTMNFVSYVQHHATQLGFGRTVSCDAAQGEIHVSCE